MVIAACVFSVADKETETRFTLIGVVLVITSLIADSVHANFQEYALKVKGCTFSELMIYSNGLSAILSFIICVGTNELAAALQFMGSHQSLWRLFFMRSISIYIGAVCYLALTKKFGAVAASEVTTARKVLTIITSYYIFPKPFINTHVWGSVVFACAVLISVYAKRKIKKGDDDNNSSLKPKQIKLDKKYEM